MSHDRGPSRAEINEETRRQLIVLARRRTARSSTFSPSRPTDWRPNQVRNPDGVLDKYFTDSTAWELIAARLEDGEEVEVIELKQPKGSKGYVMRIDLGSEFPELYVKLQLRPGKILGRSFHYTEHD